MDSGLVVNGSERAPASAISLAEVSALASALIRADREVEQAEEELKLAKERARILREESIPMAMQELGLEKFVLSSGEKVDVKQDVYASIPAPRREEAYDWLDQHGFGSLVKTDVSVQFGRGEDELAQTLLEELISKGFEPSASKSVNAQTLKAWLREQLADAESSKDLPLDLFGARPVWVTKITPPKAVKQK